MIIKAREATASREWSQLQCCYLPVFGAGWCDYILPFIDTLQGVGWNRDQYLIWHAENALKLPQSVA
jgi:hypothetical protein